MTDTSDLVEQLLEKANWRNDVHGDLHRKAAAALTAKDKEIEALRERLKAATQSRDTFAKWGREAMTRAETADKEIEALRAERDHAESWLKTYRHDLPLAEARAEAAERLAEKREQLWREAIERANESFDRAETAERERDMLGEVIEDTSRELGCESDNEEILFAIDRLRRERDEARAALKLLSDARAIEQGE